MLLNLFTGTLLLPELFINLCFPVLYWLLATLFNQRRMQPILFATIASVNLAFIFAEIFWIGPAQHSALPFYGMIRNFIISAIWIPYFLVQRSVRKLAY
jgi:hypothetical protein